MSGFRDIVGHKSTIEHLKTAVASGRVSHAYMLVGDKGMGKRTIAKAFAQTLQCQTLEKRLDETASADMTGQPALYPADIDACGECRSCRQAETNNQPDIIVWNYQKNTSISVDDIRDLVSDVQIKPYSSKYKVYILPDAQKMTREAQNALLKTLEEPPEYAVLLLLTSSRDAMLETILSRCVVLSLRPVSPDQVKKHLMEQHDIPDYQAEVCVAFAQGNIGRAIALGESGDFADLLEKAIRILTNIKSWDVTSIVTTLREIDRGKDAVSDLLDLFTIWYRDILMFKATRDANALIFRKTDQVAAIREAAQKSSYDGIQTILEAIKTARIRLRANVNFDLTMELLLLTMKEN